MHGDRSEINKCTTIHGKECRVKLSTVNRISNRMWNETICCWFFYCNRYQLYSPSMWIFLVINEGAIKSSVCQWLDWRVSLSRLLGWSFIDQSVWARLVYSSFVSCLPWHSATTQIRSSILTISAQSLAKMCNELHCIGLYRDVWIAAIASSRTSLATLTVVMCNTSQCKLCSLRVNSGMLNVICIVTYYTLPPLQ